LDIYGEPPGPSPAVLRPRKQKFAKLAREARRQHATPHSPISDLFEPRPSTYNQILNDARFNIDTSTYFDLPAHQYKALVASARSIATRKTALLEARAYATKRIARTSLNPTLRMAKQQQDWLQWRLAIDKELAILSDLDCFEEVLLADIAIDPKTGRRYQIIPTKIDLK
jgi:hypothetical protein